MASEGFADDLFGFAIAVARRLYRATDEVPMQSSGSTEMKTDAIIRVTSETPDASPDDIKAQLLAEGIEVKIKTIVRFRSLTRQFLRLGWTPP